jgi:Delta3-Delta2-enoyl-CoA isomerase
VSAIKEAESKEDIQSLIVCSEFPKVFSAGIDLSELHKPDLHRLTEYWKSFQDVYITFYGSRLACIAAIEGHAIAGGCMIAMCCDYRIMAGTSEMDKICPTIGLNEAKLGIVAPQWLGQQMIDTVGCRQCERSLQLALLYTPEDALKINLIDCVVSKDTVHAHAEKVALEFTKIPSKARHSSKLILRKQRIESMIATRQHDLDTFIATINNPTTQENLSKYLDSIAKKPVKKS